MGNTYGPNTPLLLVRVRLTGNLFENLVTGVTSGPPKHGKVAPCHRWVRPMKKLLILAVLALAIVGGVAAIEMLLSHIAGCTGQGC